MTLCDNGLLTYHPSLHVSRGAHCTWGGLGVGGQAGVERLHSRAGGKRA